MSIAYLAQLIFVTCLLICLPLFPFWKFWRRLKTKHPALFIEKGPFDLKSLLGSTYSMQDFLALIAGCAKSPEDAGNDRELMKWARLSDGLWKMAPRSFFGQIGFVLVFLYFVLFFGSVLHGMLS